MEFTGSEYPSTEGEKALTQNCSKTTVELKLSQNIKGYSLCQCHVMQYMTSYSQNSCRKGPEWLPPMYFFFFKYFENDYNYVSK